MSEDQGICIGRIAKQLTRQELQEMLAVHRLDLWTPRNRRLPVAEKSDVYPRLLKEGLMAWHQTSKSRGNATLTELGQRVMLCRVEYELAGPVAAAFVAAARREPGA